MGPLYTTTWLTGKESDIPTARWEYLRRACKARRNLGVLAPCAEPTALVTHVLFLSSKFTRFASSVKMVLGPLLVFPCQLPAY